MAKWQSRVEKMKELFPNAPKQITCRLCGIVRNNLLHIEGHVGMCPCHLEVFKKPKSRGRNKGRSQSKNIGGTTPSSSFSPPLPASGVVVATSSLPNSLKGWIS